ncbi:MAG: hypothetical protein N2691_03560 [Patescibacteria group bacterium]|nr:hypothetical protein [Patescibacteria group bacterium]
MSEISTPEDPPVGSSEPQATQSGGPVAFLKQLFRPDIPGHYDAAGTLRRLAKLGSEADVNAEREDVRAEAERRRVLRQQVMQALIRLAFIGAAVASADSINATPLEKIYQEPVPISGKPRMNGRATVLVDGKYVEAIIPVLFPVSPDEFVHRGVNDSAIPGISMRDVQGEPTWTQVIQDENPAKGLLDKIPLAADQIVVIAVNQELLADSIRLLDDAGHLPRVDGHNPALITGIPPVIPLDVMGSQSRSLYPVRLSDLLQPWEKPTVALVAEKLAGYQDLKYDIAARIWMAEQLVNNGADTLYVMNKGSTIRYLGSRALEFAQGNFDAPLQNVTFALPLQYEPLPQGTLQKPPMRPPTLAQTIASEKR